jgi:DeoR/GlpR family transcriptional regulator of sugar metabolism
MKKLAMLDAELLSYLQSHKQISLQKAVSLLNVSESTVRRLFQRIEAEGLATRLHGSLKITDSNSAYRYELNDSLNYKEKEAIGLLAARLVSDYDVIYIDWGTTVTHFCRALTHSLAAGEVHDVKVFTNSLVNVNLLYRFCSVFLLGGQYQEEKKCLTGYLTEETLKTLHFNKCFMCADGFRSMVGFTYYDFDVARIASYVQNNSNTSIMLLDHTKYDDMATVSINNGRRFDFVVTDRALPNMLSEEVKKYAQNIIASETDLDTKISTKG